MQVSYCDICEMIIKPNSKKFDIMVQEIIEVKGQFEDYTNALEYIRDSQQKYKKMEIKEICGNCKKIYDYLFKMRKEEVKEILKHIKQNYNLE